MRSETLKDGQPVERARVTQAADVAQSLPWRAAGLFAIAVGGVFWLIGARYTVFGAPIVIAQLLGLFGIVAPITLPTGWPLLGLTIIIGAIVSLMEFGARPRRRFFEKSIIVGLVLAGLWLLINAGDFASTAYAVIYPGADASAVSRWVAATSWAAILWTCFLTWTPELVIIVGWRWLVKGQF